MTVSGGSIPMTDAVNRQAGRICSFDLNAVAVDDVVAALVRDGGCFIRGFLDRDDLQQLEVELRPYIDASPPWPADFFPKETRRVCSVAAKSSTYINKIVNNEVYQHVCDRLLTSRISFWMGSVEEKCVSRPILNGAVVLSILPGANAQGLHRDDTLHHNINPAININQYRAGRDTAIGLFVAGKQTTKANGATRFIPGSHLQASAQPPSHTEEGVVYSEMEAGDAFLMLASCYHGGSANTTVDEERLLYGCFMTKGYLRQVFSHTSCMFHSTGSQG